MTPKYSPILCDPQENPQNFHTPKNIHFSENPPKILKFKILNPNKCPEPTSVKKYQSSPPPPPPGQHRSSLGTGPLFLISRSESDLAEWGMGAQLLLITFATRLYGICNGSNNIMKGGGAHTPSPQPWDWR